ncbi:MAG: NAD-dependent epimerase/dehydratase family protein [Myxococcales bacterium]|nr:NAD-dependent epimerase/dehydratase family protein [Myxococcales bacterium]
MRTLVTGASGFVGTHLVKGLLAQGREVRVLLQKGVPEPEHFRDLPVERMEGDTRDEACVREAVKGMDIVHHLAAVISIDENEPKDLLLQVNGEGARNVAEACLAEGVKRMVHFSSIHALSCWPRDQAIDESRPLALDPKTHLAYDNSKATGESYVLDAVKRGLNAVILNPVGIFGPEDFQPSPTGEVLHQLLYRRLPGLVRSGFHWVDVRDVAEAALAAETKGTVGQRYILTSEYIPITEMASWIRKWTGVATPRFAAPMWLAAWSAPLVVWWSRMRGNRPLFTKESVEILGNHQLLDAKLAAQDLGFSPRPVRQCIWDSLQSLYDRGLFPEGHKMAEKDEA